MESIDTLKESSDRSLRRAVDDHTIATRDKRVYNAFLDGILITVLLYLVNKLFPAGLPSDAPFSIYKTTLSAVAVFLYYFVFELLYHKTPAKFVTKTKVVSEDGGPLTLKRALTRSLLRLVPFEWISFYSGPRPVGWHDQFSNTAVIEEGPALSQAAAKLLGVVNNASKTALYTLVVLLIILLLFLSAVVLEKFLVFRNL